MAGDVGLDPGCIGVGRELSAGLSVGVSESGFWSWHHVCELAVLANRMELGIRGEG